MFKAAQPALLYLVPFTLLPLFMMAYLKGDLKSMWHEPFAPHPTMSAELKIWKLGNWGIGGLGKLVENVVNTTSPLLPFSWKNSVTTPFGRISKHLENWLLKNILKKKEIKHKKKSRCKDFSEDFKKKKKNETHLIPSSSHSLTSFLKLRIYEFECCYLLVVLCRQLIKLFQVVSTSEFHEY